MSFIKSIPDEPLGETKYLGISSTCNTIVDYIQSKIIVTPMSIAIHGQWGSGKTNLLKALEKQLDPQKIKVVYFDAWKHESGNPSVALAGKIMKDLYGTGDVINNVIKVAADALIRKTLDMNMSEIISIVQDGIDSSEYLSQTLEKKIAQNIGKNKKLVVLIDDLDRCDIENTLQILSMLKLFLDVKNCICVAAIDFHRVEQAWFSKYSIKEGEESKLKKEGRQYLEKIFQIRIPIPHPEYSQKHEYLTSLMPGVSNQYLESLVEYGPSNPRSIKRMINLISYRTFLVSSKDAEMISLLWTLMEENLSTQILINFYDILESNGGFIVLLNDHAENPQAIYSHFQNMNRKNIPSQFEDLDYAMKYFKTISLLMNSLTEPLGSLLRDFSRLYSASKQLEN